MYIEKDRFVKKLVKSRALPPRLDVTQQQANVFAMNPNRFQARNAPQSSPELVQIIVLGPRNWMAILAKVMGGFVLDDLRQFMSGVYFAAMSHWSSKACFAKKMLKLDSWPSFKEDLLCTYCTYIYIHIIYVLHFNTYAYSIWYLFGHHI